MSVVRTAAGTVLAGAAQALSLTSKLLEATARTLLPDARGGEDTPVQKAPGRVAVEPPSPPVGTEAVITDVAPDAPADRGRVHAPPETPVLDETPHVRTSETHIEELASKPAADVIAAVSGMSTDELSWLTEYELAHKNRRTVLAAIEKALTPSSNGGASRTTGAEREIVLPEAGGVPTSGKLNEER